MADLFVALLHYPMLDKNGQVVTTAVTNMDVHDMARSARTYGVRRFFVVTPVPALRALTERILEHWEKGFGSTYNLNRKEALRLVAVEPDLDAALLSVERATGRRPVLVVTSARRQVGTLGFDEMRCRLERSEDPHVLIFGTGWGLTRQILDRADLRLDPICGPDEYNHLSVRAAAAIVLDRLRSTR